MIVFLNLYFECMIELFLKRFASSIKFCFFKGQDLVHFLTQKKLYCPCRILILSAQLEPLLDPVFCINFEVRTGFLFAFLFLQYLSFIKCFSCLNRTSAKGIFLEHPCNSLSVLFFFIPTPCCDVILIFPLYSFLFW